MPTPCHPISHGLALLLVAVCLGCSSPAEKLEDVRLASSVAFNEAVTAFDARDYPKAESAFNVSLQPGGLMSEQYCEAVVKRAVCFAANGKADEALTELDALGPAASNLDAIEAARSYILAKQGKAAESRAALARAKRLNPRVQEFKD